MFIILKSLLLVEENLFKQLGKIVLWLKSHSKCWGRLNINIQYFTFVVNFMLQLRHQYAS